MDLEARRLVVAAALQRVKGEGLRLIGDWTGSTDAMAAWNAWFDGIGTLLVDQGNPVFESTAVGHCGARTMPGGYPLITADDLDAAIALARGCPALEDGAGVEVGVITELNRGIRLTGE